MALSDFEFGFDQDWFSVLYLAEILGVFILVLEGFDLVNQGQIQAGLILLFPGLVFTLMVIIYKVGLLVISKSEPNLPHNKLIHDTPQQHSIMFFLGLISYTIIRRLGDAGFLGSVSGELVKLPSMSLLSTAQSSLSEAQYFFVNGVMAPYIEEMFFFYAIGGVTYFLMRELKLPNIIAIVGSVIVSAGTFAVFHVGNAQLTAFLFAALTFAVIVRGVSTLDLFFDSVPGVAVLISFPIGAHMANNILTLGGFVEFVRVISQDMLVLLASSVIFVMFAFWALEGLNSFLENGDVP